MANGNSRAQQHASVVSTLLAFGAAQNELRRVFARSHGMHTTDATAVVMIIEAEELGMPLTPARLAESVGLTSGATSILLNRLEEAGHITRVREHVDRRVVTLHSTSAIEQSADTFYEPLGRRLSAILAECSPETLAAIDEAVGRMNETIVAYMAEPTERASRISR